MGSEARGVERSEHLNKGGDGERSVGWGGYRPTATARGITLAIPKQPSQSPEQPYREAVSRTCQTRTFRFGEATQSCLPNESGTACGTPH